MAKYISKLIDGEELYYLKDSEARENKADKSATVSTVSYDTTNKKITKTINGTKSDVVTTAKLKSDMAITKSDVGLSNVTNDAQVKRTEMGVANGVATLDSSGKVLSSQLPSYVDDVLEYDEKSSFPAEGETGKIYVDKTTNLTWRWSGSTYVEISPSLALGETSSTAYAGNKGKALADKLATIAEGAEVNVLSDWNATSGDAFIKNKPTIPDSFQWYGTSSTEAATVQKKVSIPSITSLKIGQIIVVQPTVTSTVADSTLKLNSFDAYPMRYNNAAITTSTDSVVWNANFPSLFVFDGSYWVFLGHGLDSNTTYSAMSVDEGTAGTATSSRLMRADYLKQIIQAWAPQSDWNATSGNAVILNKPTIPSEVTESTVSGWGFTKNAGTITGIKMNGSSKGTSGVVDLGTVITAHQDISGKVDKVTGKGLSTNDYTTNEKNKLSGIASGAEVNQNAFSNVVVGSTTISANGKTDSITLVAGSNVTLTPDATNDKITIASTDTTYSAATTSAAGLMSADDKTKLNGIATGATKVTTDTVSGWGYTKNTGTITGIKMNGASKGTSGVVDLGTIITAHLDISGKVDKTTTVNGHALSGNVSVTKSDVGLGNVTNDAQVKRSEMGAASGVATLDSNGKVLSSQLPSYVDDVIEGYFYNSKFYKESEHTTEITGETGKIYVDLSTNKTYRWGGSAYAVISETLALGETSSTAYRGDRGKIAYTHSQTTSGNPHNVTKSDVGLGNVGNFKAVSTVASQGLTDTEKSNARTNIGAGTSSFSGSYNDLSNKPTIPAAAANGTYTVKTLVGSTTTNVSDFTANQSSADDVTFVQGSNVTITPDATNRKITIAAKDTTYGVVSTSANGLAPKVTDTSKFLKGDGTWATPTDTNNRKSFYGTCDTADATAAKVVAISDNSGWELKAGTIVGIKFTNTNSASNVTLNVNSSGAKSIWYNNAVYTNTSSSICGYANRVIYYMYDGTYWVWLNMGVLDGNTDTKVTQTATTTSADYEVLFSASANNTTKTEGARKNSNLTFNPSTGNLQTTQLNGVTIGSSPKFTDNDTKNTAGTTNKIGTKMFLAAATEQSANPITYSNSNCYIGTDNCLYSGGAKVLTSHQDISGKADKTATVSDVSYDQSTGKLKKTVNGTTTNVCDVVTSGFRIIADDTTGYDTLTAFGSASITPNDSTGYDAFVY